MTRSARRKRRTLFGPCWRQIESTAYVTLRTDELPARCYSPHMVSDLRYHNEGRSNVLHDAIQEHGHG